MAVVFSNLEFEFVFDFLTSFCVISDAKFNVNFYEVNSLLNIG